MSRPAEAHRSGALSVVTIVAGRREHLARVAEGVGRSEVAPLELVVVAMDDEPVAVDAGEVPVRVVRCEAAELGLPLAAARNLGARSARGESLLFLDVDCVPGAGLAGRALTTLRGEDVIAMATVGYLPPGAVADGWREEELARSARVNPTRPASPRPLEPVEPHLFWSLSFAVRRGTLLGRIGGFDPRYVGYGAEDTDLGLRAAAAGVPVVWLGDAHAYHQHHETSTPPVQHLEAIVRNAKLFRERWGRWPMEGWLREFARRGLVRWEPEGDLLELAGPG